MRIFVRNILAMESRNLNANLLDMIHATSSHRLLGEGHFRADEEAHLEVHSWHTMGVKSHQNGGGEENEKSARKLRWHGHVFQLHILTGEIWKRETTFFFNFLPSSLSSLHRGFFASFRLT